MTNEHRRALLEALKIFIPIAAQVKDDHYIKLLEEVVVELEEELPTEPLVQDLFE